MKWGPIQQVRKKARVKRGFYLCNQCKQEVPATLPGDKRRIKNAIVDHIHPVVDPVVGFTSWDSVIERMFCEEDNLQLLCKECHDIKTKDEANVSRSR